MSTTNVETDLPATISDVTNKREFWLVIGVLTILYIFAVAIGIRRYVWFDELITFDIARSASLHQLWDREIRYDCNPPAVYVLSRGSMAIFGPTPLGLRFPSMVNFPWVISRFCSTSGEKPASPLRRSQCFCCGLRLRPCTTPSKPGRMLLFSCLLRASCCHGIRRSEQSPDGRPCLA